MMNVTVIQPKYFSGENPDEKIAEFLMDKIKNVPRGGLIVAPEYSNAGGLSDAESELKALPRAEIMLEKASMGKGIGSVSADIDTFKKYMRSAGYGEGLVKNNNFISAGLCPDAF